MHPCSPLDPLVHSRGSCSPSGTSVSAQMEPELCQSRFSVHFNRLAYLGMWSADMISNPVLKKIYLVYCTVCHLLLVTAMCLQMIDLYMVRENLRKVTFNFCTSTIVIGYTAKMMFLYGRKRHLNELRMHLWQDSLRLVAQEDLDFLDDAHSHLRFIMSSFYGACAGFLPLMLISCYFSYKWGPRQLPFAAYLPMDDPLDDTIYIPALLFEGLCAFYVISFVIEGELASFSLLLQVDAFYKVLIKNLGKINEIFEENDDDDDDALEDSCNNGWQLLKIYTEKKNFRKRVDMYLKKEAANRLIKSAITEHLKIIEYVEKYEHVYSRCLLLHSFAGTSLLIMNGIELSLYLGELSIKLCFQMGFVVMLLADFLFVCYFGSKISSQSECLGEMAYSTSWYKMDPDLRRKLTIIILRSRKPPKITASKIFIMDLPMFLQIVSTTYSWVMLVRRAILTK